MTNDKIVVYRSFDSHVEAHIIKSLLESNGIECFLSDDNFVSLDPILSQAVGGIKLHIFERDINKVEAIINSENIDNDVKEEKQDKSEYVCPYCGSSNVSFGGSTNRKFGIFTLVVSFLLSLLFVLGVYPFKMRKVYHCFDCNKEFKAKTI